MTRNSIYFIGGASASGKSTCARTLAEEFGVTRIELDGIYNVIRPSVSDEQLGKKITKDVVVFCLEKFLAAGVSGIMEGGWIDPSTAAEISRSYGRRFLPVYCGFPNADIDARLAMIISNGNHWLNSLTTGEARNWLQNQVDGSRLYESESKTHNVPFFDFSDVIHGSQQLQAHYREWHSQG